MTIRVFRALTMRRFAYALLGALGLAAACPALADHPGKLPARVEGEGSTTIVLVPGLGDTYAVWADVQRAIAANCARTFAYTRAGYEGSAPASGSRDAITVVAELRSELERRKIAPPYVLVGHSLGGLYMQYFARQFASEVSGLLLVDSTHWNEQLPANLGVTFAYQPQIMLSYMPPIMRRELADSARAGQQVHASPPAGDLPTIVLSRTRAAQGETPDLRRRAARLQQEIAADFPAAVLVHVEGSGHYIHRDRPDVVINSARELAGCTRELR
jgi:pimeloyl-ACP methyl ester carboxylesterase